MSESASTTTEATGDAQEAQESPDATHEATEAHEGAQEPQEDAQEGTEDEANPSREAKRYRLRLREVETERDALAGQLEAMRKAEAERIAAAEVSNPAGLWAAGTDIADLLDDDGRVNEAKVKEATKAAAETLGLARTPGRATSPYAGRVPERRSRAADMADVIRG